MADYVKLPKLFGSMFELGIDYNVSITDMRELENNTQIRTVTLDQEVSSKKGTYPAGTSMEWWFNAPDHEWHDPKDWALLLSIAAIMPGGSFSVRRAGKPWQYMVNGEACVPSTSKPEEAPQAAPNSLAATGVPSTTPNAPMAPPAVSGSTVTLKDLGLLLLDCRNYVMGKVLEGGEMSDETVQALTSTLFIGAQKRNIDVGYEKLRVAQLAGSGPDGEDDLPF